MKNIIAATSLIALTAGAAHAGGLDRTRLSYGVLFEKGNYVEFGFSHAQPKVVGTFAPLLGGTSTGDMAGDFTTLSFAYKRDINDQWAYSVHVNTPYGADASYTLGAYNGLNAQWDSKQVAVLLKYKVNPAVSVYGGLKAVRSSAQIAIPDALIRGGLAAGPAPGPAIAAGAPAGSLAYRASAAADTAGAFIIGAAFEKPEIALRVGLTYESGYTHNFATTESMPLVAVPGGPLAALAPAFAPSTTKIKMPQSLTLDFQSGVAKDTLVFGSIRWAEWSVWEVKPRGYAALTGTNVTSLKNDVITYQIGVGRRLNENLSVFARVGYEKANGGVASRLTPTDGSRSIGIGGSYTKDGMKVTAGVEYAKLGDAVDGSGTVFKGSTAVGFGISVGYSF